jgi:hypothetical protein
MLKIDRKLDTRSIEDAYLTLESHPDLLIAKKISDEFGIVPAIVQLVATWFSMVPNGKLVLDIHNQDEIEQLYSLDFFFPIIIYCWTRNIVDNNGQNLKPALKHHNGDAYDRMARQQSGGGPKMLLSCFDHLSKRQGLLNAFYLDGDFIDNEMTFGNSIDKALKQVVSFNRNLTKGLAGVYTDLIDIIYELMKNTDNWARTDELNRPLNPSSRGLYLKFHKKKQTTLEAEFQEQEGIRSYFANSSFIKNNLDEVYFLEISVFDTGIGFVNRYKPRADGKTYPAQEQVNIVKECLLMNNTSAVGVSGKLKGKGLDRIMHILNDKGFFWIRTGNVSIYRNLRLDRHHSDCKKENIQLYDWRTNSNEDFSLLTQGQGSVITLVYPISTFSND